MNATPAERRQSDRIWLTIPVRAEGVDSSRRPFKCEARAICLSHHGARVQIRQSLNDGQTVSLESPTMEVATDFRVVTSFALPNGRDGEYGVKCLDAEANLWGIEFPAADSDGPVDSKVLVECRKCRTIALLPLTISEVEALRAMGLLGKPCGHCNAITLWKYAEVPASSPRPNQSAENSEAGSSADHAPHSATRARELLDRGHRRVYALMPFGVRDNHGSEEMARTENISRSGFCFISERTYRPGDYVLAIFPSDSLAPKTELAAQIVRARKIEGSNRKIYGAAYRQN